MTFSARGRHSEAGDPPEHGHSTGGVFGINLKKSQSILYGNEPRPSFIRLRKALIMLHCKCPIMHPTRPPPSVGQFGRYVYRCHYERVFAIGGLGIDSTWLRGL